jgi:signal transduction histidine kinase
MEITHEMASASDFEDLPGYRRESRKGVFDSVIRAFRRIAVQRYVAPLWGATGAHAEARHQRLDGTGTRHGIASEFVARQSNAGGATFARAPSLNPAHLPGPIGPRSRVGKATALVHDLNNMLSIVQVNLQLLDREICDEDQRTLIKDAHDATELCNELIEGLFAERSGQAAGPIPLDINQELVDIGNLIQKRLGLEIQVEQDLAKNLGTISADPALLRNACLNLVANARDAMTSGGRLFIATSNIEIDASSALNHIDAKPGAYVMLSFRDTGSGIPPETLQRIFDPYFTTKTSGRSLGVGLTLVREFCQRFGGFIRIESDLGKGTTVSIYLPRHDDRRAAG